MLTPIYDESGNPWFIAAELGVLLGLANIRQTIKLANLLDSEVSVILNDGRNKKVVSKAGLMIICNISSKPAARELVNHFYRVELPILEKASYNERLKASQITTTGRMMVMAAIGESSVKVTRPQRIDTSLAAPE